jgi:PLD-like domain
VSYSRLAVGSYTFTVQATSPTTGAGPLVTQSWKVIDNCTTLATKCPVVAPVNYSIPTGARFNNPLGTRAQQLNNIRHVIATVNSMPGYRVADPSLCLNDPAQYAGKIRISLYSFTNMALARALVSAHRRCVSVQVLMNNHLSAATTPAVALIQKELGTYIRTSVAGKPADRRSFAKRCSYGCRGTGVLHSKFYLFDSRLTIPGRPRIADVTMVGSSNMTGNASGVQWNDLYTVKGQKTLHDQFASMFNRMKVDVTDRRTVRYTTGPYQTTFFPLTPGGSDPELSALRSVHCKGATGGTGVQGRTIVYINMHAWFGTRGQLFADQVRNLYANGCYIRILYSFMTKAVFTKLTSGTGSRMTARRTLFSDDGDKYADVYSHFKMIAVSGVIGTDHSAWAAWTGSNNFTNDGTHFDEVMFRMNLRSAFNAYRKQFLYIQGRKSSGTWATFLEPVGGGRAPAPPQDTKALRATTSFAVQNRQVIVAPDAISGTSSTGLHALD